jgi:hypothetical protein
MIKLKSFSVGRKSKDHAAALITNAAQSRLARQRYLQAQKSVAIINVVSDASALTRRSDVDLTCSPTPRAKHDPR